MRLKEVGNYINLDHFLETDLNYRETIAVAAAFFAIAAVTSYFGYSWASRQVTQLDTIYEPSRNIIQDIDPSKLHALQKRREVFGFFYAFNKQTKQPEPAYITIEEDENGDVYNFIARSVNNDTYLGFAEVEPFRRYLDNSFGNRRYFCLIKRDLIYGNEESSNKFLFLKALYNKSEHHTGIGDHLIKAIQQFFKGDYNGRIKTDAGYTSHCFYYKRGFRASSSTTNALFACKILLNKILRIPINTDNFMAVVMHLPAEASKNWIQLIQKYPIKKV